MEQPEALLSKEEVWEKDLQEHIDNILESLQESEKLPTNDDLLIESEEGHSEEKDVTIAAGLVSTDELYLRHHKSSAPSLPTITESELSNDELRESAEISTAQVETDLENEVSTSGPSCFQEVSTSAASEELKIPLDKRKSFGAPRNSGLFQGTPSLEKMSSAQHPVTLSGPGPPVNLNPVNLQNPATFPSTTSVNLSPPNPVRQSLGLLSLGRPSFLSENGRHSAEGRKLEARERKLGNDQERSRSAMGFIEAAACGRPNGNQKKPGNELSLPHVTKQQKAILNLRSGNFLPKNLPLILAALKEDVEKRPVYQVPPRRCKTPKSLRRLPPGAKLVENETIPQSPGSCPNPLLSVLDANWGGTLPVIKPTKEIEQKMKERKEQQEAKVYGMLHDQQLETSVDIMNSLGGELNTWLSTGQAKEAHLERLNMLWKGERNGLARETEIKRSMGEEIEQMKQKLEECAFKKESSLLEKLGMHVLRRRLHDAMRQDLTIVQDMKEKYFKVSGTCTALIEDIKRNHLQKEQAEADAAVIRKRILEARVDQEEKLVEERARRDTQQKLMADKEVVEARRKARVQEARQESLDAAKEAAVKTTQAVFANELFKGNLKLQLIRMSAAFQRIVDATGLRDVNELVEHFKDPKERVEKWRAERERAEEKVAALKDELSKLKVVLGDFELEGYSTRLRWKEFDALESKQLGSELHYLHLRESVETARYRVQEAQASLETIANSVGISLSGIDLFKGKSVEPPLNLKPLESRPIALSAEMFGLQPGQAFQRLALSALGNSEGAARLFGEVTSPADVTETRARGAKNEPGPGLIYIPGPLNGIPPETAVDIARVLKTLQLKVERLLEIPAELRNGYELSQRRLTINLRAKEMRSVAFHKLMEALEWIPPQDRLPEKPKDAKEPIDKTAMSAAVSSYIANGIAAAAVLPLPKNQIERFATRICSDSAQAESHFPKFNQRVHEDSHKRSGSLKESVNGHSHTSSIEGHVTPSGKSRKLSRQGSFGAKISAEDGTEPEEEEKADVSFPSATDALVFGNVSPKTLQENKSNEMRQKMKFEPIEEETDPESSGTSPKDGGQILKSNQTVVEGTEEESSATVGKEVEEDTSIMGARKDQDIFRKRNQLYKARRETLLQKPEDRERTRRLEERYRNVMRFIPGLGPLESKTLGLIGEKEPGLSGVKEEGLQEEDSEEKGVGKSVRWT